MGERQSWLPARLLLEQSGLRALARTLVAEDDAEDLVQDAVTTALEQGEAPRLLAPWLRQVLRNKVRSRARRRHAHRTRLVALVEPEPVESLDVSLDRARIVDALERALAALPEPYRSTVYRRFFEDLTPLQIARADGDAPATVRWRLHEGLRRIRAQLDDRFGSRHQWCGGFAAVLGLPTIPPPTVADVASSGASSMPTAMLVKVAAVIGISALTVALAVGVTRDDWTRSVERSVTKADSRLGAAMLATPGDADPLALASPGGVVPSDGEPQLVVERDQDYDVAISEALESCLADLPQGALKGVKRVEVEFAAWTLEDGSTVLETLDVTTGRKMTCADDTLEDTPIDAPGVVVHLEIATCVALMTDTDRIRPVRDEHGRIAAHDHTHGHGIVVPLDGRGRVDRAAIAKPEPLELVDVSDESVYRSGGRGGGDEAATARRARFRQGPCR